MRVWLPVFIALLPATALGWEHQYKTWCPEDMPVPWWLGDCPPMDDLTVEEIRFCVEEAFDNWGAAECSLFEWEYMGVLEGECPGFRNDHLNVVSWGDPHDELTGGVQGATLTWPSTRFAFEQDGNRYRCIDNADIVFNDGIHWVLDAEIEAGECEDGVSLEAVATHAVGHLMGLDHSCEENDPCNDQDWAEATMFWTAQACDTSASTINSDDIAGVTALYGPYATFKCSHALDPDEEWDTIHLGVVPFEWRCGLVATQPIAASTWYWGDGEVTSYGAEEHQASHVYTEPGNYSIQMCVEGVSAACGEWQNCYNRVGAVRACGLPEPAFTWEHEEGRTFRLRNESDVSVYGCILAIQWDIFAPDGTLEASLAAWEPAYTFEGDGTYRVVLNLGGPAGTAASELYLDVGEARRGCAHHPGMGWLALWGGVGLLARRRRRPTPSEPA